MIFTKKYDILISPKGKRGKISILQKKKDCPQVSYTCGQSQLLYYLG